VVCVGLCGYSADDDLPCRGYFPLSLLLATHRRGGLCYPLPTFDVRLHFFLMVKNFCSSARAARGVVGPEDKGNCTPSLPEVDFGESRMPSFAASLVVSPEINPLFV